MRRGQRRRRGTDKILLRQRVTPALLFRQQDQFFFLKALQIRQRRVGLGIDPTDVDRIAFPRQNVEDAQRLVELAQLVQAQRQLLFRQDGEERAVFARFDPPGLD